MPTRCSVCYQKRPKKKNFPALACGHQNTCRSCLHQTFQAEVQRHGRLAILRCPSCGKQISKQDQTKVVPQKLKQRLDRWRTAQTTRGVSLLQVPSSLMFFVWFCIVFSPCAPREEIQGPLVIFSDHKMLFYCLVALHNLWVMIYSLHFMLSGTHHCPGCGVATFKQDGCDHMRCAWCLTHWCWGCEEILRSGPHDCSSPIFGKLLIGILPCLCFLNAWSFLFPTMSKAVLQFLPPLYGLLKFSQYLILDPTVRFTNYASSGLINVSGGWVA